MFKLIERDIVYNITYNILIITIDKIGLFGNISNMLFLFSKTLNGFI